MANNLVKEGVERNSQRIIEAIRSITDAGNIAADFVNEGIEGFIELTENPDNSLTVRITEERLERTIEESREEESISNPETIILEYQTFVDEINDQNLVNFLKTKNVITENQDVYLEHTDYLILVFSLESEREYFNGRGFSKIFTQSEIIQSIKDKNSAGNLVSSIRNRERVS